MEKHKIVVNALNEIVNQKQLRKILTKQLDKYIYKKTVTENTENLKKVQLKKHEFVSAMLYSAVRNVDKGYISKHVIKKLVEVLVVNTFYNDENEKHVSTTDTFEKKYGQLPPSFIVLSPTQRCNLKCVGCYASSNAKTTPTLPYDIVDRIVKENHDIYGSHFVTVSGGEPFMYKNDGKTLLDIFEKYNDTFFLVYTNGTLITKDVAKKLAELGNVTPAISVEGYEKETDERRGKGVYKKILQAFENLREVGVPFGISVTATSKNVDILLTDEFYDLYFDKLGATYMWQFQLMPIGRGKDTFDLMVKPEDRVKLYRKWEYVLSEKKYLVADFWNSGVLVNGCIAYGRPNGGYIYIDWNGNIMPCVFVPYSVDNVYDLYKNGKTIADAGFSDFMKNGRKWQKDYGVSHPKTPDNWLMPCSIRDHYENFKKSILPSNARPENKEAADIMNDKEYYEALKKYDDELKTFTSKIWDDEYIKFN
ncbi:MAG: radical SAM protein [Bacteroidetes bacterium]|nr:MAG: radical SAM protein [Bacteroidota bacterium]